MPFVATEQTVSFVFGQGPPAGGGVAPTIVQSVEELTGADASFVELVFASDVTAGNLLVLCLWGRASGANVTYEASMVTQPSGTATTGTVAIDAVATQQNPGSDSNPSAIYSIPVTGTGSCTLRVNMATAWTAAGSTRSLGEAFELSLIDVSGTRVAGTNSATTDNGTSCSSGNVSTGGAGAIFGALAGNVSTTFTEDGAFTLHCEEESSINGGSVIGRLVTTNTTDAAEWTTSPANYTAQVAVAYKAATP